MTVEEQQTLLNPYITIGKIIETAKLICFTCYADAATINLAEVAEKVSNKSSVI